VGELIIEKDRILASRSDLSSTNEYSRLSRISSDMQYSVMDVRLVQVGFLFNKFHRVVRDAASVEQKQVKLKLEGTDTEIDRNILQVISDSLIHLIRNAVGHGIEDPSVRQQSGKGKEGTIILSARNESDSVIIEIMDDGQGLDHDRIKAKAIQKGLLTAEEAGRLSVDDINLLIFEPGFSTADTVTAISGRGVGMDVVKQTLDSIGGNIQVYSERGTGTRIALTLPSSMMVKSCLLFELGREVYAIPLSYTESVVSLYKSNLHKVGGGLVAHYQNKNIPIVFLGDLFSAEPNEKGNALQRSFESIHDEQKLEIVVVTFNGRLAGFVVDKLLQQKEIVEKPLMKPVEKVRFISGVTILGSGNVCLVINVATMLQSIFTMHVTTQKVSRTASLN
jgi:two-component system, chemotaxis family, sensor kinase CheA